MKVHVRLRQIEMPGGEEKILADTRGLLNGERLLYPENTGVLHTVTFGEEELILERKADVNSRTELRKRGCKGKSIVVSEYGSLEFETELYRYEKKDGSCLAGYRILSMGDTVLDQILIWEITKVS